MARDKEMYIISSHTKKIFANMMRVGASFSGVITPLFDTMMVQAPADMGDTPDEEHVPTPSSDLLPSGEDIFTLNELMVFYTNLQEQSKIPVEKDSLGAQEDASKQRKIIEEIDQNAEIALDDETQGRTNDDDMFRTNDLADEEVIMDTTTGEHVEHIIKDVVKEVSTAEPVTTAGEVITTTDVKVSVAPTTDVTEDEITMTQALARLKSTKPKVVVQEQEKSTTILTAATTVTTAVATSRAKGIVFHEQKQAQIPIVSSSKDKGKAKMIEPEARLLVELIEKRKKHFAALRAQEKRNKQPTKAQMKSQMSTYLKHIGGYKQSHLKGRSFDEIKKLFDREMRQVNDFIAMDSEAQESSTKRTAEHLESDISKKQKVDENVEPVIDDTEELKKCMEIVLEDGDEVLVEATLLSSKSPTIIDYKIRKERKKTYFKIIRADVKDRFKKEKPVDDMDNLLCRTLKTMFEHHVDDTIWTYQQGLAKSTIYYLLAEKVYLVIRNTLHQLWSIQVDYDAEMAYHLLRFIKKQFMEVYTLQ
nr:hypothetical protein [Tanacetum cinerariifolium]GEX95873.1 hypothetical protein [Tanacetum cinerariifolium]